MCFYGSRETGIENGATCVAINTNFSLIAVGTTNGTVFVYSVQSSNSPPVFSHKLQLTTWRKSVGPVSDLCWTSDGYAIAVGYKESGISTWSVYGNILFASNESDELFNEENLKDVYMRGTQRLFWGPGDHYLFTLSKDKIDIRSGNYQENNTAIDPAAVAWTHIQYPLLYIAENWPIQYSSISSDGNYIAVSGKRGFAHYNTVSNRWKLFGNQQQEQSFIRLYSRDSNLDHSYVLYTETLLDMPLYMTLCGQFLLLKSIEDMLSSNILLLVGGKLVMLYLNDKMHDSAANCESSNPYEIHIIANNAEYYWIGERCVENLQTSLWVMNGGGLKVFTNFLLPEEYDANSHTYSESEPTTPTTPGWLSPRQDTGRPFSLSYQIEHEASYTSLVRARSSWKIDSFDNLSKEAVHIPLDFYPISVLIGRGIIVGIEQSISFNTSLGITLFKMSPKMHLFLHHIFRHLLQDDLEQDAVTFARAYEKYVYFGHALEILLHTVLEEEAGQDLKEDQFRHALDVIVSCARKTEVALWGHLFSVVGKPKDLFEVLIVK
ncbi:RIC1-domain-containing protein [Sporodiniella umbellata]|nr:RIC1-domain-containing protein [Sporodiniella umbellata]